MARDPQRKAVGDTTSADVPEHLPQEIRRKLRHLSGFQSPEVGQPSARRLDYDKRPLYLYVTSRVEQRSRLQSCAKEPWTVQWIEEHATPGDVFYDIGANVGAYTLIAATHVGPSGRVVAFEPGYASYAHLCDNMILNSMEDVIVPVPIALGRATGLGSFGYHSLYPGHARHGLGSNPALDKPPVATATTVAMTLDDAIGTLGLPAPHLIKLDVDGTELDVLEGAARALALSCCRSLLMEVAEAHSEHVVGWLRERGLELANRYRRERDGVPADWWYGVFVRRA